MTFARPARNLIHVTGRGVALAVFRFANVNAVVLGVGLVARFLRRVGTPRFGVTPRGRGG